MDPNTAYTNMLDKSLDDKDRSEAGITLLQWLIKDGCLPNKSHTRSAQMDPNTAYTNMINTSLSDKERSEAATALLQWLIKDGCLPNKFEGPEDRRTLIFVCKMAIHILA